MLRPARLRVRREFGRLLLAIDPDSPGSDPARVAERLGRLPGIAHYAAVIALPREVEPITAEAIRLARASPARSFRVRCRRSDKRYPITSVELNRLVGGAVNVRPGRRSTSRTPS